MPSPWSGTNNPYSKSLQLRIFHLLLPNYSRAKLVKVNCLLDRDSLRAEPCLGLTFDQIAKELGKDEIWVASAFYGQVSILEQLLRSLYLLACRPNSLQMNSRRSQK